MGVREAGERREERLLRGLCASTAAQTTTHPGSLLHGLRPDATCGVWGVGRECVWGEERECMGVSVGLCVQCPACQWQATIAHDTEWLCMWVCVAGRERERVRASRVQAILCAPMLRGPCAAKKLKFTKGL